MYRLGLCVTISGHRKSPQNATKVNTAKTATPARTNGSMMREKIQNSVAPSMRAESRSSSGRVRKNWRMKKVPKALKDTGKISPR